MTWHDVTWCDMTSCHEFSKISQVARPGDVSAWKLTTILIHFAPFCMCGNLKRFQSSQASALVAFAPGGHMVRIQIWRVCQDAPNIRNIMQYPHFQLWRVTLSEVFQCLCGWDWLKVPAQNAEAAKRRLAEQAWSATRKGRWTRRRTRNPWQLGTTRA